MLLSFYLLSLWIFENTKYEMYVLGVFLILFYFYFIVLIFYFIVLIFRLCVNLKNSQRCRNEFHLENLCPDHCSDDRSSWAPSVHMFVNWFS